MDMGLREAVYGGYLEALATPKQSRSSGCLSWSNGRQRGPTSKKDASGRLVTRGVPCCLSDAKPSGLRMGALYEKYATPLSNSGMNFSPGTFLYRPSPRRST